MYMILWHIGLPIERLWREFSTHLWLCSIPDTVVQKLLSSTSLTIVHFDAEASGRRAEYEDGGFGDVRKQ